MRGTGIVVDIVNIDGLPDTFADAHRPPGYLQPFRIEGHPYECPEASKDQVPRGDYRASAPFSTRTFRSPVFRDCAAIWVHRSSL